MIEYLQTGLVPRLPTAVLATGLMLLAFLSLTCGLILDTVTRGRWETEAHVLSGHSRGRTNSISTAPASAQTSRELDAALSRLSILRFAVIGALGMPVDAGVLWLMTHRAGLDPYSGRVISWLCAATFTWIGNRNFTFGASRRAWLRAPSFGNGCAFSPPMRWAGWSMSDFIRPWCASRRRPLNNLYVALVLGVWRGLIFNFTLSKKLVFKGPI